MLHYIRSEAGQDNVGLSDGQIRGLSEPQSTEVRYAHATRMHRIAGYMSIDLPQCSVYNDFICGTLLDSRQPILPPCTS